MYAYTVANPMVRLLCKHPSSFLPLLNSPGGHSRWGNPTAHLLHPCAKAAAGDKTYFQLITTDFKWALYIPRKSYYIFLVSSHSQSLRDYFTSLSSSDLFPTSSVTHRKENMVAIRPDLAHLAVPNSISPPTFIFYCKLHITQAALTF